MRNAAAGDRAGARRAAGRGPRRAVGAVDVAGPAVAAVHPAAHRHHLLRLARGAADHAGRHRGPRGRAAALRRGVRRRRARLRPRGPDDRHLAAGTARARRGGARAAGVGAGQPAFGRLRAALAVGRPAVRHRRARAGGHRGARGGGHRRADRRPAHLRGAGVARRAGRGPARAHARRRRRAADRAVDPAPGPAAGRGHRAGRVGGARGRRARPGRGRQRPAGAAAALGVVRPDGLDRGAGLRRAARLRRRRQPPAAQPAHRAAAAAVQPRRARRPGRAGGPGGGAGGGRAALHAARRPARAGQGRAHGAARPGRRGRRGRRPHRGVAARSPSTPGCGCAGKARTACASPRRPGPSRPCSTRCSTTP